MASKKKRRIVLMILLALPLAIWYFFFRAKTDQFGNKWSLGGLTDDPGYRRVLKDGADTNARAKAIQIIGGYATIDSPNNVTYYWNKTWVAKS